MTTHIMTLLDTVLDRTVAPGYSRLGFALRSRGWSPEDPEPNALHGKTVLVTGANSGLGKAAAAALARLGATVLMTVRNRERGERAQEEIVASVPGADVRVEVCDVSELDAVRAFAAELSTRVPQLDVLIHNAGAMPQERTETDDGHETALATHVLGPLLLTELLVPLLDASGDGRVIFVTSGGMYAQRLPADDPEYREGQFRGAVAYSRTKRMQVVLTPILARRWAEQNVTVCAMHPGWADTPGVSASLPGFHRLTSRILRTPEQGADTAVWLAATATTPATGLLWHDRRPRPEHYLRKTRETTQERERFWRFCVEETGLDAEYAVPS